MNTVSRNRIIELISAAFILLFVYTALSKISSHDQFVIVLEKSPLLKPHSYFISWFIPFSELFISLLLLLPRFRFAGLVGAFALMSCFTVYIAYMIAQPTKLPCTCGGVISKLSWTQHFWFNLLFTFLAAFGTALSIQHKDFIAINRGSRKPV